MGKEYLDEIKKQPYSVFIATKPYSFELNEDMIVVLSKEFDAVNLAAAFAKEIAGKNKEEIEKAGNKFFENYGEKWMRRTMQLGNEYPDRTIEVVQEAIDGQGKQFLIWPHVPQRFVEIAYLSTQHVLKLPIVLNNQFTLAFRIPRCLVFNSIKEKTSADIANLMLCKHSCLNALHTVCDDLEINASISLVKSTAKDNYCEFSLKKF